MRVCLCMCVLVLVCVCAGNRVLQHFKPLFFFFFFNQSFIFLQVIFESRLDSHVNPHTEHAFLSLKICSLGCASLTWRLKKQLRFVLKMAADCLKYALLTKEESSKDLYRKRSGYGQGHSWTELQRAYIECFESVSRNNGIFKPPEDRIEY